MDLFNCKDRKEPKRQATAKYTNDAKTGKGEGISRGGAEGSGKTGYFTAENSKRELQPPLEHGLNQITWKGIGIAV